MNVAVVIPVKGFGQAKRRLAPHLSPDQRRRLAMTMAERVLAAGAEFPRFVVCDNLEVKLWAEKRGATVVWSPGSGLDQAVSAGVAHAALLGAETAIVSHADLPGAVRFSHLVPTATNEMVAVADRHRDGTNVIVLPTGIGFRFSYGPGSYMRHLAEAQRLGLRVTEGIDTDLSWDIDSPDDLAGAPGLADVDQI